MLNKLHILLLIKKNVYHIHFLFLDLSFEFDIDCANIRKINIFFRERGREVLGEREFSGRTPCLLNT